MDIQRRVVMDVEALPYTKGLSLEDWLYYMNTHGVILWDSGNYPEGSKVYPPQIIMEEVPLSVIDVQNLKEDEWQRLKERFPWNRT